MADVVLGVACSHGPMLSGSSDLWPIGAAFDKTQPLFGEHGQRVTYEELVEARAATVTAELAPERMAHKSEVLQAGLKVVEERIASVGADVMVIVGNDHAFSLFGEEGRPPFTVFCGEEATPGKVRDYAKAPMSEWMVPYGPLHFGAEGDRYPCEPRLGRWLVESLTAQGFDINHASAQYDGRSIGEAFIYTYNRLMKPTGIDRMVPVVLNNYEDDPPNLPGAGRCYEFGVALRRAIEGWEEDARVVLLASGGMSHFVVDEEFDRMFLGVIKGSDPEAIAAVPAVRLGHANTELRQWIMLAGAMAGHDMTLVAYEPCYRSLAGTGGGLACAYWEE